MRFTRFSALLLVALCFCMTSCVIDSGIPVPDDPDQNEKVRLELFTLTGDYEKPVDTRTGVAEEGLGEDTPWVLVFRGSTGTGAVFFEAQKAVKIDGKLYVTLYMTSQSCRVLLIANAPDYFYNGTSRVAFTQENLEAALDGQTYLSAVNNILFTELLASPLQAEVPYAGANSSTRKALPMAGFCSLVRINNTTSIGTQNAKVSLTRALAKVTVKNQTSSIQMKQVWVENAPRNGRFYEQSTGLKSNTGNLTAYGPVLSGPTKNTTEANPIYVYESRKADNMRIIVEAFYGGLSYYYPLAFVDADRKQMDVLRNCSYEFVINSVSGPGYSDRAEALVAPALNIDYTIEVTNESEYEIVDNGQYYLAVSNSELEIYTSDLPTQTNKMKAFTFSTNAPQGLSVSVTTDHASSMGTLYASLSSPVTLTGSVVSRDVEIYFGDDFLWGYITVQVGNIKQVVYVNRVGGSLSFHEFEFAFSNEYLSGVVDEGRDWLSMSFENNRSEAVSELISTTTTGQTIYVFGDKHYFNADRQRKGSIFLSKNNKRIKVYFSQENLNYISEDAYVGAFFRHDQYEERIIRIGENNSAILASIAGAWTATVLEGDDFIRLAADDGRSYSVLSATITNPSAIPAGSGTSVSGVCGTGNPIAFRIGLTGALASENSTPRFGIVLLEYTQAGVKKNHLIWVRQGQYPVSVYGTTRWSPYNMTHPTKTGGTSISSHPEMYEHHRIFTDFPSQSGFFYTWNLGGPLVTSRAYHPYNPTTAAISGWIRSAPPSYSTLKSPCPIGYMVPLNIYFGEPNNPRMMYFDNDQNVVNGAWGFYADGFFDRHAKTAGQGKDASSAKLAVYKNNTVDPAYAGYVFFNQDNYHSVFMPAAGYREGVDGILSYTGTAFYGTSSSGDYSSQTSCSVLKLDSSGLNGSTILTTKSRNAATSMRCIAF